MPRPPKKPNVPRIYPTFTWEEYDNICAMAARMGMTPSAYVRQCSLSGLNGSLGQANIDFITQIMTEQIRAAMQPFEERMTKLQVKTCIQAGTALYTSAEAINRLVPADYQEDMVEIVNNARKKAVQYVKRTEE